MEKQIVDVLQNLKSWPFIEAKKILLRIKNTVPDKGYVLFETGYGPSGLPHIGTFTEVLRTTMVMEAFKKISDIPTKLVCFSDDLDALRKVPDNLPNQDMLTSKLGLPLTSIPDPFEKKGSYGEYMNAKLCNFLDHFGFEYVFYSATELYNSGEFDKMILVVLEKYEQIMNIMLPTLREERRKTYSPFMPICPKTGLVLQVKTEHIDYNNKTILYKDNNGELIETQVTKGKCKLQWKVDFAMRWAHLAVDYEIYGKEHRPNTLIYQNLCKLLGGVPPILLFYELFLDSNGEKISKSKGNSIALEQLIKYAPVEAISLFVYHSPNRAKKIDWSIIPKSIDEYLLLNEQFHGTNTDLVQKLDNPIFHVHKNNIPKVNSFGLSFSLLLNLISACNISDKNILWNYISKYNSKVTKSNGDYISKLLDVAISFYFDIIKDQNKSYIADDKTKTVLYKIANSLATLENKTVTAEYIQNIIYDIGMNSDYPKLSEYFKALYRILLGQDMGPRFGSLILLLGINNTIELINSKLKI
ncbi:lysine--tRNA ligase [Rickettsia endosymbiont of Cardiosporidium cionae]|uniref:lysine--tRNA ligase n=1 Tax=Rickettsia endosymbiont of Cardiosporidium cionae TaxID=2777155 RepID=UPI001892F832|nr:lysine--tRNA ligase [Rickettsia endosymbiont of Cardiosporidium cionae]KAF8818920.1 lysine--tRNA ligase [Rickettsia endosymbiont of Cardiosporidium cionae]